MDVVVKAELLDCGNEQKPPILLGIIANEAADFAAFEMWVYSGGALEVRAGGGGAASSDVVAAGEEV